MKLLTSLLFVITCCAGIAQMGPPPAELAKLADWVGTWKGTEKMHGMGGDPVATPATIVNAMSLGGRYLEGRHSGEMAGTKFEGLHMCTYDPDKKTFVAFWFDSTVAGALELSGNFVGSKLVMESKAVTIPGMDGPQFFRAEWELKDKTLNFNLFGKQGEKWEKVIEGTYTKQ